MAFEGSNAISVWYPPYSDCSVPRSRRQIISVRRKCDAMNFTFMAFEGSNAFSARYPPYYGYSITISRRQILSVWRNTTLWTGEVASEGFDTFSARYLPHFDYTGTTSRHQILSVRRKYYASDSMRVALESFDKLSPQLSTFFPKYTLSAAYPRLSCPLYHKFSF